MCYSCVFMSSLGNQASLTKPQPQVVDSEAPPSVWLIKCFPSAAYMEVMFCAYKLQCHPYGPFELFLRKHGQNEGSE